MSKYKATIGLEIHAELKTKTKMFCNSKNDPDEKRPNVNICPVCMAYPGTLPTVNFEAVKHVVRVGCAVNGEIADYSEFDRKNYFYPDIPKGYQISQYKYPIVKGGMLNGVKITRIHLEEDTARSVHITDYSKSGEEIKKDGHVVKEGGSEPEKFSLVDFNRAGVPLMELVTEPVIHSAEEASRFAKEFQLLLQTLGAGEANMEKGEMRVEANISISPRTNNESGILNNEKETLGTKVEVKNLNSFKAVEKAIAYELARHEEVLEKGEKLVQETRGWDENEEVTFSQRAKEDSHDYRYFPDPDIPKLKLSEVSELNPETIKENLEELPWKKRERYEALGVKPEDAEVYVRSEVWGKYFDAVIKEIKDPKLASIASNYLTSDLLGMVRKDESNAGVQILNLAEKMMPKSFATLVTMFGENKISSRATKDILKVMYEKGGEPEALANEMGLMQKSDEGELTTIAQSIIDANPNVVAEYKSGKTTVIQFLVGQGMKATNGSGNPAVLKSLFEKLLG